MAITGITTTANNGVARVTDNQDCNGATIDGETIVLDGITSRLRATSASGLLVENSQIKCDSDVTYSNDNDAPITYGIRSNTINKIRITKNSLLLFGELATRKNIFVSEVSDSSIIESGNTGQLFVYTQTDAILNNCLFRGINVWEVYRSPSIASGITVDGANFGYLNWEAGRLDFLGFAVANIGTSHAWLGSGNSGNNFVYHWNNDTSFDNTRINFEHVNGQYWEGYTWSPQFKDRDSGSNVEDVLVIYDSDISGTRAELGRFLTNVDGKMVGTYDSQNQSTGASQVRDTLFLLTAKSDISGSSHSSGGGNTYDIDVITPYVEVRSYLHEVPTGYLNTDSLSISSSRGILGADYSVNTYENFNLVPDASITELDKAVVEAYTELETPQKFYDRAKSEWRDNDNYALVTRSGETIDAGSFNVVIDATAVSVFAFAGSTITVKATVFTGNLTTTGTVTLLNGAIINGITTSVAGSNSLLAVSNLTSSNVQLVNDIDVVLDRQTNVTGSYSYITSVGLTGAHKIIVNREGYQPSINEFTLVGGESLSFSGLLIQDLTPSGSAMYQGSSSGFLNIIPTADGSSMRADIANGTVTAQQVYDETEVALMTEDGMTYLGNSGGRCTVALLPTGTFLFLQNSYQLRRESAGDASATVEAFVSSTQGTVLDSVNGSVQFVTVTRVQQLTEYGGHVYIDVNNGSDESAYPYGTQAAPVKTWAQAKTIAEYYGIRDIRFTGLLLHTSDAIGYMIEGSDAGAILVLQGHDISRSAIRNAIVTGDAGNPEEGTQIQMSYAENLTNYNGVMDQVILTGPVTLTGERNYITRCASAVVDDSAVVLTVSRAGHCTVSLRDWYGRLSIGGVSHALNTVSVDSDSGDIELLNTNTAGLITLRGEVTTFVDNSAGSTVTTAFVANQDDLVSSASIADAVWDEPLTGAIHNLPTSAGRRLRQASVWTSAEGLVVGTPTTTSIQTDLTEANSSFYSDQTMVMVSGVLAGQARVVTSYDGATKTCNFDEPWTLAPTVGDEFAILANHVHPVSEIQEGVTQALVDYNVDTKTNVKPSTFV